MKKIALCLSVVLFLFASSSEAGWRLNRRGGGGGGYSSEVPGLEYKTPSPENRYSAAVRIYAPHGAYGSGAVIEWGNQLFVLTNYHVTKEDSSVSVTLSDGKVIEGKIVAKSNRQTGWDCVAIRLAKHPDNIVPAILVDSSNDPGILEICGFGPQGQFATHWGDFRGLSGKEGESVNDWFQASGAVRNGDSGGPVYTKDGRLYGILWGAGANYTIGVQPGRLSELLNEALSK